MKAIPFEKKDVSRAAVEHLKRELPTLIEHMRLVAKIKKAKFDAFIDEGFTKEQALELCKGGILE